MTMTPPGGLIRPPHAPLKPCDRRTFALSKRAVATLSTGYSTQRTNMACMRGQLTCATQETPPGRVTRLSATALTSLSLSQLHATFLDSRSEIKEVAKVYTYEERMMADQTQFST